VSFYPFYDLKAAIAADLTEIDMALDILNGLREVNQARLALLLEAEKRAGDSDNPNKEA
jgi:hypothetical protein